MNCVLGDASECFFVKVGEEWGRFVYKFSNFGIHRIHNQIDKIVWNRILPYETIIMSFQITNLSYIQLSSGHLPHPPSLLSTRVTSPLLTPTPTSQTPTPPPMLPLTSPLPLQPPIHLIIPKYRSPLLHNRLLIRNRSLTARLDLRR